MVADEAANLVAKRVVVRREAQIHGDTPFPIANEDR
jgi:hypothetical protein